MFRLDSDAGILHRNEHLIGPVHARSDPQVAIAVCHRTHALDAVHQVIRYDLLQLDTVAIDRWKGPPEIEPQSYSMNADFPADQRDDVVDDLIYIEPHTFEGPPLGQRADTLNHVARVPRAADHLFDRATYLVNSWHLAVKPSKACIAIRDDGGEWLVYFMGDGGCQFTQRRHARYACEFRLRLAQGFRGEHMLGEVAADREHGLHPVRVWPQRRVGHRQVAPAKSKVEPPCITDFLSREAPVVIRLGRLLKAFRPQEVGYVLPDERLRRHTPSLLEGRVHPLKTVIWSDDGYAIRRALEYLSGQVFRPFALGQVEHEGDALVSAFVEGRSAEKHGHAAAVLPKVLLLERFVASGRPELYRSLFAGVVPFGGGQRSPAEATRNEIVAAVSHHVEKGFVGVENATFNIPHDYPDDVRVDQAADPGLPFLEIVVQTGVLQRDRRLRCQQFQHRDPGGREHVRCQLVFEIEHPDQLRLLHQGQAEDRPGVLLTEVLIRRERILHQGIINDHAFPRPDHGVEHGF